MKGINHVTAAVRDLDRAIAFYCAAPGLEVAAHGPLIAGPGRAAVLRAPNAFLELVEESGVAPSAMPVQGPGVTHVCFQSPATAGLFGACVDQGASRVTRGDAVDLGGYGVRYGYARDADGLMFEVEELDEPHFDTPVWLAHVALVSPDIDRLVDFYRGLLAAEPYRREDALRGRRLDAVSGLDDVRIRAAWFRVGNMVLELWEYLHPATPAQRAGDASGEAGYRSFTFEVEELSAAVAHLESLGLDVDVDASAGVARTRDPDGNAVRVVELPAGSPFALDRLPALSA